MKRLGKAAQRAKRRAQRWWAKTRREGKRERRAREHMQYLLRELEQIERRLAEHPDSDELQERLRLVIAAIDRTANRRDRRKHRRHVARQKAKFWVKRNTVLRKKYRKAKAKWEKKHQGDFETWMLNGHSGDIDSDLKPVIAFLVGAMGQTITDTYDYSGHTSSSLHYPRNDPSSPQQGRAVDSAGPNMAGVQQKCKDHFGAGKFLELFGPQSWYVKNGGVYSTGGGAFPGHDDHQHSGVA